jgi:hypothetical protein
MMDDWPLFDFESDFVNTLRCIPMAVRFKLDACRIKLSLRQWSRFTLEDRHALRLAPCVSQPEVSAYRAALVALVAARTGDAAKPLPDPVDEAWRDPSRAPAGLIAFARSLGLEPPTVAAWAGLTPLQRFTLQKLTRDNHDNINFVPALHEFGLIGPTEAPPASKAKAAATGN